MNKFVLSAVAACALGFAGMSYAADLPEGWAAKDAGNGVTVITKSSSGVSLSATTIDSEGASVEDVAKGYAEQNKCKYEVNDMGHEVDCDSNRTATVMRDAGNGKIDMLVVACGNADDQTCQADAAEILSAAIQQ